MPGECATHPISPKSPAPQYQSTGRRGRHKSARQLGSKRGLGQCKYFGSAVKTSQSHIIEYPVCPHRQGGCLACWRLQGCKIESRLWLSSTYLYQERGAQGVLPMRVWSATIQLDLPSLTPLPVAGCGRLELGVPQWATSVDYCK